MTEDPAIGELLALVDRLEALLDSSELSEIEVEAAGTTLRLRKPAPLLESPDPAPAEAHPGRGSRGGAAAGPGAGAAGNAGGGSASASAGRASAGWPPGGDGDMPEDEVATGFHAVIAPLTGVFYLSPSPGADPYVRIGGRVNLGQVIGLIEAMKLFNEIKSDVTGTVRSIGAETGALVKAKQTLIEVEIL